MLHRFEALLVHENKNDHGEIPLDDWNFTILKIFLEKTVPVANTTK